MLELYRPSLRAVGAIAVLLAWLASLTWLEIRRMKRTEDLTLSSEASLRLAPGTVWYAVYAGSTQVGHAGITLDTLSPGYRVSETVILETRNGAGLVRATWLAKTWLGTAINIEHLESRYSREGKQRDWTVAIAGDTLVARLVAGTRRTSGRARLDGPATASLALPYRLALGGALAAGQWRTVRMFDGWPLGAAMTHVTVGRDSMVHFADSAHVDVASGRWVVAHTDSARAFAVMFHGATGPRRLWVDRRGAVSGLETPLGVTWVRTDFDLSATEFRKSLNDSARSILAAVPIMAQFAATTATRDTATDERRFILSHRDSSAVAPALLAMFAGGRQEVRGDTLIVHATPDRAGGDTIRLAPLDPMIQHEALAIVKVQRNIMSGTFDRDELPGLLKKFRAVARIDTSVDASDDALGTLGAHVGRPDGIARLFVALLRASGVASRYVIGVYPRGDTLLTHAWVEILSPRGRWYAVDPSSGRAEANTGLIRLAIGGSSHPDEMLTILANARVTEIGRKEQQ